MKRLWLFLFLLPTALFGAVDITLIDVKVDKVVYSFPSLSPSGTYLPFINGVAVIAMDTVRDAKTVTMTVGVTSDYKVKELKVQLQGTSTFTNPISFYMPPPQTTEVMSRDSETYSKTDFRVSNRGFVIVGNTVFDSIAPYNQYLYEIVVAGEKDASVALYVGDRVVSRYSYGAFLTSGQIFSSKIFVPKNTRLRVVLEGGTSGNHSASIAGAIAW